MGVWGAGLYASDIAADMKASIKTVLRLPFDEDRIVAILRANEPAVADDPDDEDHTIFWLVLADQFEKLGVAHPPTRQKALAIIEGRSDLDRMERRGMNPANLRKRAAGLDELRARLLVAPSTSKPRKTIGAPEAFILETKTLYAVPVKGSAARFNWKSDGASPWTPDGWRQFVILNRGRAFDHFAWYQPIVSTRPVTDKPLLSQAEDDLWWSLDSPKTCSAREFAFMGIEEIGALPIDLAKARLRFPERKAGVYLGWDGRGAAIQGLSIGDCLFPGAGDWEKAYAPKGLLPKEGPTMMRSLAEILASNSR